MTQKLEPTIVVEPGHTVGEYVGQLDAYLAQSGGREIFDLWITDIWAAKAKAVIDHDVVQAIVALALVVAEKRRKL